MKETVIQFGEGNFLRGFADYFLHILNQKGLYDGKAVLVQPIRIGNTEQINSQKGIYNLYLRGIENGEEKCERTEIHSVSRALNPYAEFDAFLALAQNSDFRFIISNTTEAGIQFDPACKFDDAPPSSFPAKLTRLLYERFKSGYNGFVILACELIDNNGKELESCVLKYAQFWKLGEDFFEWVIRENRFCSTLVDRIVTGYPKTESAALCKEIGYNDALLDTAELYHLWVIEGNFEKELPLQTAGLNVVWTNDVTPYKKRKVRVLNGAHTSLVFPSLLCGVKTVGESLQDAQLKEFLNTCLSSYILPMLGATEENKQFACAVLERFQNPYIHHMWQSIALNSVSKFTARVLPTVTDYMDKEKNLPKPLVFSLACLIAYYKTNTVQDDDNAVEFIKNNVVSDILSNYTLWNADLSCMTALVNESLERIHKDGIREAIKWSMS